MKTNLFSAVGIFTAAIGLTACPSIVFAASEQPLEPPSNAILTITVTPPIAQLASGSSTDSAQWSDIKNCTFDMRAQFFDGFKRLEARVDDQISELNAKRATMNSSTNTKDWDFAMKEMVDARAYLKSAGEELSKASPETWDQQKDKVGLAWVRTQDAYAKVKSSTTS